MILYRKGSPLRIRRSTAPVPPYWNASALAPYSAKRTTPLNLDALELRVSYAERVETTICDDVLDDLERGELRQPVVGPVVIDATGTAEPVYRRGAQALRFCEARTAATTFLLSARGAVPPGEHDEAVIVFVAWPADSLQFDLVAEEISASGSPWGLLVPVVYPLTTELPLLTRLADLAQQHGARFLAAASAELEQSGRGAIARTMTHDDDDDRYATLFHSDPERLQTSTERHIAALAEERDLADFVVPPRWEEKSNWNAATLLTLAATRMLAMEYEVELAGTIARSARVVATLDKDVQRIAEAASLSIVEPLDEVSADILTEWLESGHSTFVDRVNSRWRLRRDYVAG